MIANWLPPPPKKKTSWRAKFKAVKVSLAFDEDSWQVPRFHGQLWTLPRGKKIAMKFCWKNSGETDWVWGKCSVWNKAFCSITCVLEYLLTYHLLPLCWQIKCCLLLESDLFCNLDSSIKSNDFDAGYISKFKMSIGGMSSKSVDLVKIYYFTNLDFPVI